MTFTLWLELPLLVNNANIWYSSYAVAWNCLAVTVVTYPHNAGFMASMIVGVRGEICYIK